MTASGSSVFTRFRRLRTVCGFALAAALATVLLAPAASAKKSTTTSSTSTTTTVPAAWDPRIQPIADQVAQLRGLAFVHPVAAEFLDDAAFEQQIVIDQALTKADKQELARDQATIRAFGLIGPDVNLCCPRAPHRQAWPRRRGERDTSAEACTATVSDDADPPGAEPPRPPALRVPAPRDRARPGR